MSAVYTDFYLDAASDGTLQVVMTPPAPIGGQSFQFTMSKRFNNTTPILTKSMASGFYGVSGMNIANSGAGVINIAFNTAEVSGILNGNYAYNVNLVSSGIAKSVSLGYRIITPG